MFAIIRLKFPTCGAEFHDTPYVWPVLGTLKNFHELGTLKNYTKSEIFHILKLFILITVNVFVVAILNPMIKAV